MSAKLSNVLYQEQLPPLGTILAWAKGLTGIPALGGSWAECDGGTHNGIVTPDLRSNAWIMGSTTYDATALTDCAPRHVHNIQKYDSGGSDGILCNAGGGSVSTSGKIVEPNTTGNTIKIVYIMRVG